MVWFHLVQCLSPISERRFYEVHFVMTGRIDPHKIKKNKGVITCSNVRIVQPILLCPRQTLIYVMCPWNP